MSEVKINRRTYLKIAGILAAGFVLPGCKNSTTSDPINSKPKDLPPKPTVHEIIDILNSREVIVFQQSDADYESKRVGFNLRVQKKPKYIALCKSTKGVSEAIKFAQQEKLAVAVKSGGHSFEGFSSNNGGLVVDLSLFKKVKWLENNRVSIQPGVTLSEVYDQILPKKRIIPMGSCGGVGVGGLTLGGGYGLFSRKYGLTCDHLEAFTMVDGLGNIVHSSSDKELAWACRGGGNGNFGVVTDMTFRTHEAPDWFIRHRFKAYNLTAERARLLLDNWFTYAGQLPGSCFAAFVLNHKTLTLLITDFEEQSPELTAMIDQFKGLCDKYIPDTKKDLAPSLKKYYGIEHSIYFKNACAGLYSDFNDLASSIDQVIAVVGNTKGLIFQVNTLGGAINTDAFKVGSSYPHRALPFMGELQAYYDKPEQEARLVNRFQEIQGLIKTGGVKAHYRNYPDLDFKDWESAYYAGNYTRLQAVKRKYDPNNLIRHEQSVRING